MADLSINDLEYMGGQPPAALMLPSGEPCELNFTEYDPRVILWFDIDNTLYSKNINIAPLMTVKIQSSFSTKHRRDDDDDIFVEYFMKIGLSEEEAHHLHRKYYKEYGLAIRGLVRHHKVDPIDYNLHCDAALPLDTVLSPNKELTDLFESIDPKKARVWGITNAYRDHAARVLRILNLEKYFEAVVYCDYGNPTFNCKPEKEFFDCAQRYPHPKNLQITPEIKFKNRFIDDSVLNVKGAIKFGWPLEYCLVLDEDGVEKRDAKPTDGSVTPLPTDSVRSISISNDSKNNEIVELLRVPHADRANINFVKDIQDIRIRWADVFK